MTVIYLAIFILLIIAFLYYLKKNEFLDNKRKIGKAGDEIYTAGATMRVIGQSFSSADQDTSPRSYNILYKIDRPEDVHALHYAQKKELEPMVNQAQAPEFWELNPILAQFKETIMTV
jgi:hypothetical protein